MITPEEFPYIKSLYVNDCYADKDFNIELHDYKPFSHLILTGKNGSGKSTILRAISRQLLLTSTQYTLGAKVRSATRTNDTVILRESEFSGIGQTLHKVVVSFSKRYEKIQESGENRLMKPDEIFNLHREKVFSYFEAKRGYLTQKVEGPSKESDFISKLNSEDSTSYFSSTFKQYLVNKKVYQAFDQLDNNKTRLSESEAFFNDLTVAFRSIFEDENLSLVFVRESFEFLFQLSDGRQLTFDVLPEGFSSLINILMDLFMRVDLIRKQVGDYSYNPCGIVLIDEPEVHLHLQLQEQVLPLLTSLFRNIQFIVATHSPAVIASIKQATIFDLTTKESRISEETAGRSYSDLMMSHFDLNNEYSAIADDIIAQIDQAVAEFGSDPDRLREMLQPIYDTNSAYLSPTLKVKFELLMAEQKAKAIAHS